VSPVVFISTTITLSSRAGAGASLRVAAAVEELDDVKEEGSFWDVDVWDVDGLLLLVVACKERRHAEVRSSLSSSSLKR
jgi:hypothetical protein